MAIKHTVSIKHKEYCDWDVKFTYITEQNTPYSLCLPEYFCKNTVNVQTYLPNNMYNLKFKTVILLFLKVTPKKAVLRFQT